MSCKKNVYQTKIFLISALLNLFFLLSPVLSAQAMTVPYDATYQDLINPDTHQAIGCSIMDDCTTYFYLSCDTDQNCLLNKKAWQGSPAYPSFTGDTCEYKDDTAISLCGNIFCDNSRCKLATPTAIGRKQLITSLDKTRDNHLPTKEPFSILNPLANLQIKIPGLEKLVSDTPAVCTTEGDTTSCSLPWISIYIKAVYNYAMGVVGILAALALMIGGVIYLTSAGNATRISEAKSWITGALTGMLIMFTSYVLLNEVNPDLIGFKSIKLSIVEEDLADTTEPVSMPSNPSLDPSTWKSIPSNSNICPTSAKANQPIIDVIIAAADCMGKNGLKIELNGGSRTVTAQATIYDTRYDHQPNQCNAGGLKPKQAPACCPYPLGVRICPHTSGSAFDLKAVTTCGVGQKKLSNQYILQDCMQAAGAYLLNSECWHFEYPQISVSGSKSQVGNHNSSNCGAWPK